MLSKLDRIILWLVNAVITLGITYLMDAIFGRSTEPWVRIFIIILAPTLGGIAADYSEKKKRKRIELEERVKRLEEEKRG